MKRSRGTLYPLIIAALLWAGCGNDGRTGAPQADTDSETDSGADTSSLIPTEPCETISSERFPNNSNVGCEFFAATLDTVTSSHYNGDFTIVVSNPISDLQARITVQVGMPIDGLGNFAWETWIQETVAPLESIHLTDLPAVEPNVPGHRSLRHATADGTAEISDCRHGISAEAHLAAIPIGFLRQAALRITSTTPVIAHQFNPLNSESTSRSDASMLLPVAGWGEAYHMVGPRQVDAYESGYKIYAGGLDETLNHAYAAVIAARDNTEVTITPSTEPLQSHYTADFEDVVVPADGDPFMVRLDQGDMVYVHTGALHSTLSGTIITANPGHPIAVFSGHQCALIPEDVPDCENVEEQLPPLDSWGRQIVAARLPVRKSSGLSEPAMWQIYAPESGTEVELTANASVSGLPFQSKTFGAGELVTFYAWGSSDDDGSFYVSASAPVAVLQYMTGSNLPTLDQGITNLGGDPAMAYVPPVERFANRQTVLVPPEWVHDELILMKHVNARVFLDGAELADSRFTPIGASGFATAHIPAADGLHTVETDHKNGVGVIVSGYDDYTSYAYTGGLGLPDEYDGPR